MFARVLFIKLCLLILLGGLLVSLPRDKAKDYCKALEELDGHPSWIIGDVVTGPREARLSDNIKTIDV